MSAIIVASSLRTCLGDGPATFGSLLQGLSGSTGLRYYDSAKLKLARGHHIKDEKAEGLLRPSQWLTICIREALAQARIDPKDQRVVCIVGSGLRELRTVERWALEMVDLSADSLHFANAVHSVSPHIKEVVTLSNACSAGGHALALAQDLIESGEADAVIAAGTDAMAESMLAMIGRFTDEPLSEVRPFDSNRTGVLLGEGASAVIVAPEGSSKQPLARLLSTGLSCDAHHETAPHLDGIRRAMWDALERADRAPEEVDLVVAHGTGTALNDPVEAQLIREVLLGDPPGPFVTAVKGSVGHTSGSAALVNLDVALRCMQTGRVPPVVGLREPLADGRTLRFVTGSAADANINVAVVNAFGFGGVNAITVLEKAST
jgi:3-oxoacyl-[acyl-carrier-protein] synthase II